MRRVLQRAAPEDRPHGRAPARVRLQEGLRLTRWRPGHTVPSAQHHTPGHGDSKGDISEDAHRGAGGESHLHRAPLLPGRRHAWAVSVADGVGDQSRLSRDAGGVC